MRDIIFKGKRKDNGEWVEGYLLKVKIISPSSAKWVEKTLILIQQDEVYEVIPETVGQYTGLTDKNGKKIWEGDIVRTLAPCCIDKYIAGVVMFGEYSSTYQSSNVGYYVDWSLNKNIAMYCKMGDIEVIGNVFDNPELIEVN